MGIDPTNLLAVAVLFDSLQGQKFEPTRKLLNLSFGE